MDTVKKVQDLSGIKILVRNLQNQSKTVGYAIGVFDVIHEGHINFLKYAKSHCNCLVVGLNGDTQVRLSKGKNRPINDIYARLNIVSGLESVDIVFPMECTEPTGSAEAIAYEDSIAEQIGPDFIFSGIKADSGWKRKETQAKKIGAKFVKFEADRPNSSSRIISLIEKEL